MPRIFWIVLAAVAALWIGWCVLVVERLVPMLHRHITMWPWLMAYVLCLMPVIALMIGYLVVTGEET